MGPGGGSTVVDVTTTVDRKFAALHAHASQTGDWDIEKFMRQRMADLGAEHGFDYAESFRVITPPRH